MSIPIGMFSTTISTWPALRRAVRSAGAPATVTGARMPPESELDASADAERPLPPTDAGPRVCLPFAISRIADAVPRHHRFAISRACPGTATPSVVLARRNLVILKVAVLGDSVRLPNSSFMNKRTVQPPSASQS
jgi:hypothetical protein